MRRWSREIEIWRQSEIARNTRPNATSATQFTSLKDVPMENPHLEDDVDEDDYKSPHHHHVMSDAHVQSEFGMSRNTSSTSLRSRSATQGSGGSGSTFGRPPSRFPMPDPASLPPLNTQMLQNTQSASDTMTSSYFSPVETTPMTASARSSSQSNFAPHNRYGPPVNGWSYGEEAYRNTAPAMSRNMSGGGGNPYLVHGRGNGLKQSLGSTGTTQTALQLGMSINRMRSASSPDIHPNTSRRYANGQITPNGDQVPTVPPIPTHVAGRVIPVNRSQSNSPANAPVRTHTTSPANLAQYGLPSGPRPPMANHYHTYDPSSMNRGDPRQLSHAFNQLSVSATERALSPPPSTTSNDCETFMPTQLKAKVCFDNNYITLVIHSNIQFRSLTDRIDAKLARFTNHSIGGGSVRLRYRDEDGDFIWIDSDEAVHDAFLDWRETHADKIAAGQVGEILLFCHSVNGEPIAG